MQLWEHRTIRLSNKNVQHFIEGRGQGTLHEYTSAGWQLAALTPLSYNLQTQGQMDATDFAVVLKRPEAPF